MRNHYPNDVTTTVAPRPTRVEQRTVAPVAALRVMGEVCPTRVIGHLGHVSSVKGGVVVATDDRGFAGTRAWSPPGC